MTYRVKEIYYTLQGEGTHTGRAGRVLPVHQLQPVDRAGTGPGPRGLPVLRHRLRGHGRARRGAFRDAQETWLRLSAPPGIVRPAAGNGAFVVCTGGEPLLQLDQAAVEAFHARRIRGGGGDQRNPDGAAWPGLGVREPQGRGAPETDQRR